MYMGRKSRLKERGKNPYYFGASQWQKSLNQHRNYELMYRGLKVTKPVAV